MPVATVARIHSEPTTSENDRDKIGFTVDVAQRLGDMTIAGATGVGTNNPIVRAPRENLAESA